MIDLDALIRGADPARDLVIPEPNAADIRRVSRRPPRSHGSVTERLAAGVAVAVAIGVGLVVLLAGGQRQSSPATAGRAEIPTAAQPLARILGVLRSPQTAADRAVEPKLGWPNPVLDLTRLAAVTPWGQQVVLVPERTGHQDALDLLVSRDSSVGGFAGNIGHTARAVEAGDLALAVARGPADLAMFIVVPDGVARVAFVLAPTGVSPAFYGWTGYAPLKSRIVTVPVHNNVAFLQLHQPCCAGFPTTRWYASDGRLIKVVAGRSRSQAQSGSLSQPSTGRRVVFDVLHANGIAGTRFGASPGHVRAAIDSLVRQNGGAYVGGGGECGLDHSITWRTTAGQALAVYFGHSRFVGYQFGALARPQTQSRGWALATSRGLKVGDPLARGRRLYGAAFSLSSEQGGVWKLRSGNGPMDGYAWGTPKYGDVSWQSVVATIDAGNVGCPALSP